MGPPESHRPEFRSWIARAFTATEERPAGAHTARGVYCAGTLRAGRHCPRAPSLPLSFAVYRRSLPDGISTPIDVGVDNFRHIPPAIHTAALKTPRLSRVRPGASVGMQIALHAR